MVTRAADPDRAPPVMVLAAESDGVTVRAAVRDWGPATAADADSDGVTVRDADPVSGPEAAPEAENEGVTSREADRDSATLPAVPDAENEGLTVSAELAACAEGRVANHTPE